MCSWGRCNSDNRYKDREHMKGVSFRKFPMPRTQRDLCLEWIRACNRPHEQLNLEKITHYHYVCSKVSAWPNLIFPCWLLCSRLVDLESRSRSKEKSFGRDGLGGPGNPELFVTFWAPVAGLPTWPNCDQMWEIWPNGKSFDRMFFQQDRLFSVETRLRRGFEEISWTKTHSHYWSQPFWSLK